MYVESQRKSQIKETDTDNPPQMDSVTSVWFYCVNDGTALFKPFMSILFSKRRKMLYLYLFV